MCKKIYFSEWTDYELETIATERCYCDCHQHPGIYPTSEEKPCSVCQHINAYGYCPGFVRDGWVEYWRSDRAGTYREPQRV